jgi:hypothetical protein
MAERTIDDLLAALRRDEVGHAVADLERELQITREQLDRLIAEAERKGLVHRFHVDADWPETAPHGAGAIHVDSVTLSEPSRRTER